MPNPHDGSQLIIPSPLGELVEKGVRDTGQGLPLVGTRAGFVVSKREDAGPCGALGPGWDGVSGPTIAAVQVGTQVGDVEALVGQVNR